MNNIQLAQAMRATQPVIVVGDQIRDGLGHWYLVVSGGPWQYRVQPLTMVGTTLQPFGTQFTMGRSEMRADGE